jgi:hypothetical protein
MRIHNRSLCLLSGCVVCRGFDLIAIVMPHPRQ